MAEKYDFVFVGGGHNALTCAAYLAKAGQSVIVLERRDLWGGGVMTEELTTPPGFKHNTHSCMHEWIHVGPVYKDLELEKHGSKYVEYPELVGRCAVAFENGDSLVWWQDQDRFLKDIEYFSRKDAKKYRDLWREWSGVKALMEGFLFAPPVPLEEMEIKLAGTPEGRELLWLFRTSTENALNGYFESDHLKALMGIMITQAGTSWDALGTGFLVPSMTVGAEKIKLAVGGSKTLADAMVRVIEENRGLVKVNSDVKRIITQDGVATGVRLSDGSEYISDKAVVCNVGPTLIFGEGKMVEDKDLDETFMEQIHRWRAGEVALFTPHYALNEAPLWKAAQKNPDLDKCWDVCVCESPYNLKAQIGDIRKKVIPRGEGLYAFMAVMPTKSDPTQAPPGKHTAFIWVYTIFDIHDGGAEKWNEVKKQYADEVTAVWSKYTTNINKDNIIARHDDTPLDIATRNPSMIGGDFCGGAMEQDQMWNYRPFHGYPPYRTPIENLYMCGPTCHPGGGCSGAPGYNAANVLCDEFKIKKWWKPFVPEMK